MSEIKKMDEIDLEDGNYVEAEIYKIEEKINELIENFNLLIKERKED